MKIKIDPEQYNNIAWKQWENRSGVTQAHAIDPTSEKRTGKVRTFSGALIPAGAVDHDGTTPKDPFSVQLVEQAHAAWKAAQKPAKAEKPAKAAKQAKEGAEKPADPPTDFEIRFDKDEAQIWTTGKGRFKEDMLAGFPRKQMNSAAPFKLKIDETSPMQYKVTQKVGNAIKAVAKGSLDKQPTVSAS